MEHRPHADRLGLKDRLRTALARKHGFEDRIRIKGHVRLELRDECGRLKVEREVDNLITTVGRANIVEQLVASPTAATKVTHMGVGTSGTAATVGDTTITGDVRVALTSKTRATNVLTMVGDWGAGVATGALQEAGCWTAATVGTLDARATFGTITKAAGDTLKITWTWTIG